MFMIGFFTLLYREIHRILRIWRQSFLPIFITTSLYFIIFASVLGQRIGDIQSIPYGTFIAPGILMMNVINNSYVNSSFSVFFEKYHQGFFELLNAPLSDHTIILSFALGSVFRGLCTAALTALITHCFIDISYQHYGLLTLLVISSSLLLSLMGIVNGLLARDFDDTNFVPTFILSPLTFLSGVFFSLQQLSPFWQWIASYNPLATLCQMYRSVWIGLPLPYAWTWYMLAWSLCSATLWLWAAHLMKKPGRIRH